MDNMQNNHMENLIENVTDIWLVAFTHAYDVLGVSDISSACATDVTNILVNLLTAEGVMANSMDGPSNGTDEQKVSFTEDQLRTFWEYLGSLASNNEGDKEDDT